MTKKKQIGGFETIDLGEEMKYLNLHPLADLHWGAPNCEYDKLKELVKRVEADPNARIVGIGDLINNNLKTSKGSCYEDIMPPSKQIETIIKELAPVKDKILYMIPGNHPSRTKKEVDINPGSIIATALGVRYSEDEAFFKICLGKDSKSKRVPYIVALHHGEGLSSGKVGPGSALNSLERYARTLEGIDIIIAGHVHQYAASSVWSRRFDSHNNCWTLQEKKCVLAPSWLSYSEGYIVRKMYTPSASSVLTPIIFSGTEKLITVQI